MNLKRTQITNSQNQIPLPKEKGVPAKNFKEVFICFDPKPLVAKEELDQMFIERPRSPLEMMKEYLLISPQPVKILFSGHRGSGKSTELNKLLLDLHNQFFIVKFSITETLDPFDLNYIDVLLTCSLKLLESAIKNKVRINKGILKDIFNWLHYDITEEKIITTLSKEADLESNINLLVITMTGKMSKEEITRRTMREKIRPRLSQLIERINLTINEIKKNLAKDVIVIIEDIDKTNLDIAQELFFKYVEPLLSINSKIIYTFPIALRYSDHFPHIARSFDKHFVLPNITICDKSGNKNILGELGEQTLKEVILKRINPTLISDNAVFEAIRLSGGLMIDLIALIKSATLYTLTNKEERIEVSAIHQAANDMRNDYRVMLRDDQYQMLRDIHADKEKRVRNDDIVRQLLHNLSLLEYRNDDVWADVHPIVKPLL